jgi:hypothetical protein
MIWYSIAVTYVVAGIFIMTCTRARKVIAQSSADVSMTKDGLWKVALFWVIILAVGLLLWPLLLKSWFVKKQSVSDALQSNPIYQQQKQLFDLMDDMSEDGCNTDELPNGHGAFGYEPTNPIPTNTVFGSTSYLARLCALDGLKVVYERNSSVSAEVSPHPIDEYTIRHPNGTVLATLFLSPYQKNNSEKAPKGFTLTKTIIG